MEPVRRRSFLASLGMVATGTSLAGCTDGERTETPEPSPEPSPERTTVPPETPTDAPPSTTTGPPAGLPRPADPDAFAVDRFATFDGLEGGLADDAFQLLFSTGERDVPPGLFVSGGSGSDDRLFLLGPDGGIRVFATGFTGSEGMVHATGDYGEGLLVAEPRETRIRRVLPDGTVRAFASVGTDPFGPAGLAYGPHDGRLYATDFTGRRILRVTPDGEATEFATYPDPGEVPDGVLVGPDAKALVADAGGRYGGTFLAGQHGYLLGKRESTVRHDKQPVGRAGRLGNANLLVRRS